MLQLVGDGQNLLSRNISYCFWQYTIHTPSKYNCKQRFTQSTTLENISYQNPLIVHKYEHIPVLLYIQPTGHDIITMNRLVKIPVTQNWTYMIYSTQYTITYKYKPQPEATNIFLEKWEQSLQNTMCSSNELRGINHKSWFSGIRNEEVLIENWAFKISTCIGGDRWETTLWHTIVNQTLTE